MMKLSGGFKDDTINMVKEVVKGKGIVFHASEEGR